MQNSSLQYKQRYIKAAPTCRQTLILCPGTANYILTRGAVPCPASALTEAESSREDPCSQQLGLSWETPAGDERWCSARQKPVQLRDIRQGNLLGTVPSSFISSSGRKFMEPTVSSIRDVDLMTRGRLAKL